MENKDYINDAFTKENDNVNLEVDNINATCITSKTNKFNLDSDGNLTVKSINIIDGVNQSITRNDILDIVFPVGSIYFCMGNINPENLFGGVWKRIAKGRTLVGIDEDDIDFSEEGKIGGEKTHLLTNLEIPEHKPVSGMSYGVTNWGLQQNSGGYSDFIVMAGDYTGNKKINLGGIGGSRAHNNLQPYLTCYIWQRTE